MNGHFSPHQWMHLVVFAILGICVGLSSAFHDGTVPGLLVLVMGVLLVSNWPEAWRAKPHNPQEKQ